MRWRATDWGRTVARAVPCFVGAAYFVLVSTLHPFRTVFEFDQDEGFETMKAVLLGQGHALYSQIWDDQPPLFTYLLWGAFRGLGRDIVSARLATLLCAAVLVAAVYDMMRRAWGHGAAFAAVLLLPCTTFFMKLSVSAMAGLPAVALATLCLCALLRWNDTRRDGWLVAAGVSMGLSLVTKFFTGFLLPLFGGWLLLSVYRDGAARTARWQVLRPPLLWTLAVLLTAAVLLLAAVPLGQVQELYRGHVALRQLEIARRRDDWSTLMTMVSADWEVGVLAALGTVLVALRRRWPLLLATAWCLLAFGVLSGHAPIFYHYQVLLTVPACMLAGVAIGELWPAAWRRDGASVWVRLPILLGALAVVVHLAVMLGRGENRELQHVVDWGDRDRFVVAVMETYATRTTSVVVDRLMYPLRAGYEVPPNMVVVSRKRMETGQLPVGEVLDAIKQTAPEQIVTSWNFPVYMETAIARAIADRYRVVYADENMRLRLWVRDDIVGDPLPALLQATQQFPSVAAGHDAVGLEWARRGEDSKALDSFRRALETDPRYAGACRHLAEALMAKQAYEKGFDVLQSCVKLVPYEQYVSLARIYAWRRATCPDSAQRNGREAGRVARQIMTQLNRSTVTELETLGAALAAQGKYDVATKAAQEALALARNTEQGDAVGRLEKEIESFRRDKPWIELVAMPSL